jgi:Tfp pilus assembly protein PilF
MLSKRILFCVVVAGVVLVAGCGHMDRQREEARKRWSVSRAEIITKLAEGCFRRGELGRARQHIEEITRDNVPYAPLYILAARLAAEKGEWDTARLYAENAKAIDPKSAEARYVLGTIEQTLNDNDRALAEYSAASHLDPNQARYVLAEAEMHVALGKPEEAAKTLDEAIGRMAGQAELYAALGDVMSVLRRHDGAAEYYRIAMRLEPQRVGLKERLGAALYRAGAYAEAEPVLAEVAAMQPGFATAWAAQMRADCLLALGRVPEARTLYQDQANARPGAVEPMLGLAKCDLLENRLVSAHKFLESVLACQPRHTEANALMGYVLVASGRPGEARPHLALALQDPRCADRETLAKLAAVANATADKP